MVTLRDLKPHAEATILEFVQQSVATERLVELGILPGTPVQVLARLPFGGPIVLRVGETFVAVRLQDAAVVRVKAG